MLGIMALRGQHSADEEMVVTFLLQSQNLSCEPKYICMCDATFYPFQGKN